MEWCRAKPEAHPEFKNGGEQWSNSFNRHAGVYFIDALIRRKGAENEEVVVANMTKMSVEEIELLRKKKFDVLVFLILISVRLPF